MNRSMVWSKLSSRVGNGRGSKWRRASGVAVPAMILVLMLLLGGAGCSFDGSATPPPWDLEADAAVDAGLLDDLAAPDDANVAGDIVASNDGGDISQTGDVTGADDVLEPGDSGDVYDAEDADVATDAGDATDPDDATDATDAGDVTDPGDATDATDVDDTTGTNDTTDTDSCALAGASQAFVRATSACLTAGSDAKSLIVLEQAEASWAVSMTTSAGETLSVTPAGSSYYAYLDAPADGSMGAITVSVTATDHCGGDVSLGQVSIQIKQPFMGAGAGAGGCEVDGNMRIKVVRSDGITPIESAFVMLGEAGSPNSFATSFGSTANTPNTVRTDVDGYAYFHDLEDNLSGPTTVTAGAIGHAYSSLIDINASDIVLQLDRVYANQPTETYSGKLENIPNASGNIVRAGFMFDDIKIEQMMDFRIDSILADTVCYRSNFFIDEFPISDNIFVPGQFVSGLWINEKKYTSPPIAFGAHKFVGIGGRVSSDSVQGATILEMLEGFAFQKIGVRDETVASGSSDNDADIDLGKTLSENVSCSGMNAPDGSNVLCLMLGDWDSGSTPGMNPGAGRLFLMGLGVEPDVGSGGSFELQDITTVSDSGDFAGIEYLAVSVASYFDPNDAPNPEVAQGVSIVARRGLSWGAAGGSLTFDDYLPLQILTRNDRSFSSTPGASSAAGRVPHFRRTMIRQRVEQSYSACGTDDKIRIVDRPLWTVYAAGTRNQFTLPEIPSGWPRATHNGLIDPAQTGANDTLSWSHSIVVEGLNPAFEYDAIDLNELSAMLTHVSTNSASF